MRIHPGGSAPAPRFSFLALALAFAAHAVLPARGIAREYLTPKEIERMQDTQEIDRRIKILVEAAALRLKTAEERLNGKESEPGDPLEFYSVEEMLEAYYEILRSVMLNLDGAVQKPRVEPSRIAAALRTLKDGAEKQQKSLAILKRMAEEKRNEPLWNLVGRALEVASGARDGAESGLTQYKEAEPRQKRKKGGGEQPPTAS